MITLAGTTVSVMNEVIIPYFPVRYVLVLTELMYSGNIGIDFFFYLFVVYRVMMRRSATLEWRLRALP